MKKIKYGYVIFALLFVGIAKSQIVEISGKVIVDDAEIEGIHIINKTANKFTITRDDGSFVIPVKLNDTIIFSAIKYKPKEVVISFEVVKTRILNVYLTELVNELDEVIVGKVLTGNLASDLENSDAKRTINFYDLGIPGYTGKPKTLSENRLNEATTGGGFIPLNPLLNYLSGRTKQLKNQVKIERLNECMETIKANLAKTFFENNELEEAYRPEFFYYCSENEDFNAICQVKNDMRTLEFLKSNLELYKVNLQSEKD